MAAKHDVRAGRPTYTAVSPMPLTTIRSRTSRSTHINVSFGADRLYDLDLHIDPSRLADDDTAPDGVLRPAAQLTFGGLNANDDAEDKESRVERYLGEDELRAMGKALLAAAGKLRRIESARRRVKAVLRG